MKNANKIYDLLATGEEENMNLAYVLVDKWLSEWTVLGFAAMFTELQLTNNSVVHEKRDKLLGRMEELHLKTFNEPLHYMVREMFYLAMHGSYQSIFSLEFTHRAYQKRIEQLYKANRNLIEINGKKDESRQLIEDE